MDEDEIPDAVRKALTDRYEGWELVELLSIRVEDVIDAFEMDIMDNLEDLKEELKINYEQDDTED